MQVVNGIYEFKGVSNCYVVLNKEIFLVDTGMPGRSNEIISYMEKNLKRDPKDIETIVITHHHFDHTGSLDKLKKITGAKVAIHSDDAAYLSGEKVQTGSLLMRPLVRIIKFIYQTQPVKGRHNSRRRGSNIRLSSNTHTRTYPWKYLPL